MWTSAKLLAKGVLKHWMQLVSGAFMAIIALVAAIKKWTVPPWIWLTASAMLVAWAVLQTFHDIRIERDAALQSLAQTEKWERLANSLSQKYREARNLLILGANSGPEYAQEWLGQLAEWNQSVYQVLKEEGCPQYDVDHITKVPDNRASRAGNITLKELGITLLKIRSARVDELAAKYATLAERWRFR
jgi:hypothetical protein